MYISMSASVIGLRVSPLPDDAETGDLEIHEIGVLAIRLAGALSDSTIAFTPSSAAIRLFSEVRHPNNCRETTPTSGLPMPNGSPSYLAMR